MGNLPFIDGLRAVAIAAVVGFHAFPGAVPGGFAGVDVFFVISGFLITRLILTELEAGTFSLSSFFMRRARRLLPAALVCFAVVALLSAFVLLPDAFWYLGRSLLSSLFMYANFFFYNTGGYFSAPSLEKPLLHTWSLAVEDQFYLTWPLLLAIMAPRVTRGTMILVALALLALSLWFAEINVAKDAEFAFFMLFTRAWELLIGAALALAAPYLNVSSAVARVMGAAGFAAVLSSFWLLTPDAQFPGMSALPACAGTALIIASCLTANTNLKLLLSVRPLVFLGLVSYSLYLWHWPLISLASYHNERALLPLEALAVIAASLLLAILSWRYVEAPFRLQRVAGSAPAGIPGDRTFLLGVCAAIALLAGTAGALKVWRGFPQRYQAEVRTLLEQLVAGNPLRRACDNAENVFANDEICNFGRKKLAGQSYEVVLFGDSMADHWTPLVAKFAEEKALAGRQVTNGGCLLAFGTAIPARPPSKARECLDYQQAAGKFIAGNPGLRIAFVSAYWEKWLRRYELPAADEMQRNEEVLPYFDQIDTPAFDQVLAKLITTFTSQNIKVVLIGQIPTYVSVPVRCIVAAVREKRDAGHCGKPVTEAAQELAPSNAALLRAAKISPHVSVWLPSGAMCQGERCALLLDGTLLYKNGKHVNRFGALYLGRFAAFPALD